MRRILEARVIIACFELKVSPIRVKNTSSCYYRVFYRCFATESQIEGIFEYFAGNIKHSTIEGIFERVLRCRKTRTVDYSLFYCMECTIDYTVLQSTVLGIILEARVITACFELNVSPIRLQITSTCYYRVFGRCIDTGSDFGIQFLLFVPLYGTHYRIESTPEYHIRGACYYRVF